MRSLAAKQDAGGGRGFVLPVLIGVLFSFICSLCFLGIFAVVMTVKDLPQGAITPLACLSLAVGAFVGGFVAARIRQSKGFFSGVIMGLCFFLILFLTGVVMREAEGPVLLLVMLLVSVVCGGIGCIAGMNMKRRRARI